MDFHLNLMVSLLKEAYFLIILSALFSIIFVYAESAAQKDDFQEMGSTLPNDIYVGVRIGEHLLPGFRVSNGAQGKVHCVMNLSEMSSLRSLTH